MKIVRVRGKKLKGKELAAYIEKTHGIRHVQREGTTLVVRESAKKPTTQPANDKLGL